MTLVHDLDRGVDITVPDPSSVPKRSRRSVAA